MDDIYDTLTKGLYKIQPAGQSGIFEISPEMIGDGSLLSTMAQNVGNLQNKKTKFTNDETGYILGVDKGVGKFFIGNPTNYFNWDGSQLTLAANSSASAILLTVTGATRGITIITQSSESGIYISTSSSTVGSLGLEIINGGNGPGISLDNTYDSDVYTSGVGLKITNENLSRGTMLELVSNNFVSTHFKKEMVLDGVTIWISDGTTPNGNLSGTAGDVCLKADSSQEYYCTGTTNWSVPSAPSGYLQNLFTLGETLAANDAVILASGTSTETTITQSDKTQVVFSDCYGSTFYGQTFKTGASGKRIYSVTVYGALAGAGNPVSCAIWAASSNLPSGGTHIAIVSMAVGTSNASLTFTFATPVTITANTTYAIVVKATTNGVGAALTLYGKQSDVYADGQLSVSTDNGSSWAAVSSGTYDLYFSVAEGDLTAGDIYKTNVATSNELFNNFIGFSAAGNAGDSKFVVSEGIMSGFSGLTAGANYYLSNSAGLISTTPGTLSKKIGKAVSATQILIDPIANVPALPALVGVIASDTLQYSLDTERTTTDTAAHLLKSIKVLLSGTYRVSFDGSGGASRTATCRIYKNGVAYGTSHAGIGNGYQTFSQDLYFYAGDSIDLYAQIAMADNAAKVRNFRLYYDKAVVADANTITDVSA